jgi:hypothetical protein
MALLSPSASPRRSARATASPRPRPWCVIAQAEVDRSNDAAFAVVDLIHATTGRRAFTACGFREPVEGVEGYITERITTVNLSYIIRTVRAVAARHQLVGFSAPFMFAPTSTEYAVVMAV